MRVADLVNYLNHVAGDLEVTDIVILKGAGEDAEVIDIEDIEKSLSEFKSATA